MSVFSRFTPRLQDAIVGRLGWSSLRPVQEEAGEALLDGDNAVVLAPTAGGKTEASMFPTLSMLMDDPPSGVGALYIAPIKALLNNQAERLGLYTEMVGLRRFVWHGDVTSHARRKFKKAPAELLMTTPESLEVMLISKTFDEAMLFGSLRMVIVDEVHAMAGTDRGGHLMSVVERLARVSRYDVQRAGLSATVGNPEAIATWLTGSSKRPARVVDPPKKPARRRILVGYREGLAESAQDAAKIVRGQKALFFCQSRRGTERVAVEMRRAGTEVYVHHSAVSREERERAEEQFHRGSEATIVCTSTLELGIDVGDLDLVLQADTASTVGAFLQRMGRTGRRPGKASNTTFFCHASESIYQAIAQVELAKRGWVEHVEVATRAWTVLVHQLLAMSLAADGIAADDVWEHMQRVPDVRGIRRVEFDRLVNWMLRDGGLRRASGRLILGPKAEKRFGRKNFLELFAVFTAVETYMVQTPSGDVIGTLEQEFVDQLVDSVSSFLLAGRPWLVTEIRHSDRRVVVGPAPRGKEPDWASYLPRFIGFEQCQEIKRILAGDEEFPYLDADAAAALATGREGHADVASGHGVVEFTDDSELRWWTYAGGRINGTLKYALQAVDGDWKVASGNLMLRVHGEGVDRRRWERAIARLQDEQFWQDDQLWNEVAEGLPNFRVSKFQVLMPPWVEREVVATLLLDVAGAWRWLTGAEGELERVPGGVGAVSKEDEVRLAGLGREQEVKPLVRDEQRPVVWVRTEAELERAVDALKREATIGLDVETTLEDQSLCLIQFAGAEATYLIDPLEVVDLSALDAVLTRRETLKVIHNASFERSVLGRYALHIEPVLDTLDVSRKLRGGAPGGHSLRAAVARELGLEMSKAQQKSDWSRRPLTDAQIEYAVLDAEVLLQLAARFEA